MWLTICTTITVVYAGWESLPKRNWENREPTRICKSKHLTEGQERLCRRNTDHMPHLNVASENAVKWCQVQLTDNKWNCSAQSHKERDDIFGRLAKIGSRESAFISAMTSASLVHTMAKACRQSLQMCGCSSNDRGHRRPPRLARNIEWNPCGDEFLYATKWAEQFTQIAAADQRREVNDCLTNLKNNEQCELKKKSRSKSKQMSEAKMYSKLARVRVNELNNKVGRMVTVQNKKLKCKCHGPSGSCQMKTCMWEMPTMDTVSDKLKSLYQEAQQMKWRKKRTAGNQQETDSPIQLYPFKINRRSGNSSPDKVPNDALLYISKSPNFCEKDDRRGILGTSGRKCKIDSNGADGCREMCCGRGYYVENQKKLTTCNCKFEWCCEVKCDTCEENIKQAYCK